MLHNVVYLNSSQYKNKTFSSEYNPHVRHKHILPMASKEIILSFTESKLRLYKQCSRLNVCMCVCVCVSVSMHVFVGNHVELTFPTDEVARREQHRS